MFTFAVILALAAVATADFPLHDGRIVGGEDTTIEEYPHQVSLQRSNSHFCGGSIVTSKHVVTAAHCVVGQKPAAITVREGSTTRGKGGKVHESKSIVWYPKFTMTSLSGDVGIITLEEPIVFSETAKPIKLVPINEESKVGELLAVTGWGRTDAGGLSSVLQVVQVPAVSRETCDKAYSSSKKITALMMCAGISAKDSCQGDSGGPLINKKQELVGIVSWGRGCGTPGYPGVYGNVANKIVHDFITNHTKVEEEDY